MMTLIMALILTTIVNKVSNIHIMTLLTIVVSRLDGWFEFLKNMNSNLYIKISKQVNVIISLLQFVVYVIEKLTKKKLTFIQSCRLSGFLA